MTRSFQNIDQLREAVGVALGPSEWVMVDQQRVDTFADATGDHQWIHVDPDRAAGGPFGRTIAHGYLSLSLVPAMVATVVEYSGWGVKINYGSNKVRFPAPVPVDSRVRAGVTIAAVDETPAGVQVTTRVQVDIEDPDGVLLPKPALVAELVTLLAAPTDSSD
jgi:acyl dehydratase